ncbi:MAG: hypothetical protein JWP79_969 [Polaromonas sp.]|jgi:hypothetical protein|nr:hypothetical protein [Polaromonas sp.]MDB5938690.1 hypothetical protein [Polaromonas sp.]
MGHDARARTALGLSLPFIAAAFVMHRVFLNIPKTGSPEPLAPPAGHSPPSPTPLESHE